MGDAIVSTIVTTKNSARTLGACLASLTRQTYPASEIIVVDNYSTDSTRLIAADYGASILTVGPERSAQRNYGAGRATGEYLLFIDSDMVLEEAVVEECVAATRDGAEAVVIPEASFGEGFWARCKRLERRCYVGDNDIEAARFYTRSLFSTLRGFDEQLSGPEDWDLHMRSRRLHASLARTNAVIHHDEGDLRLSTLLAKKYRYGKSFPAYRKKHRGLTSRQFRVLRPAFVRNRAILLDEPFALAGIALMKSLEFAAGAAGALSVVALRRRPESGD